MSLPVGDIKKSLETFFKIVNEGASPDPSKINDELLRGIVRNFQQLYKNRLEAEQDLFKESAAKASVADFLSRGGSALLPKAAPLTPSGSTTADAIKAAIERAAKLGIKSTNPSADVEANIKLGADRAFSKVVKRLSEALENGYLDANRFLIWAIALATHETLKYDLLLISLILRFGKAEKNMYLLVPEYGNVHLIIYTVLEMEKKLGRAKPLLGAGGYSGVEIEDIFQVLLLLTLAGSKTTSLAIYEEKVKFDAKGLPQYDSRILTEASKRDPSIYTLSVAEWLKSKKYPTYLDPCQELDDFNKRESPKQKQPYFFKMKYGLLLDNTDFAFPEGLDEKTYPQIDPVTKKVVGYKASQPPVQPQIWECTTYNATKVAKNLFLVNYVRSSESDTIRYCIDTLAYELFENCLLRGFKMSYFTVNRLVLAYYKVTKNDKEVYQRIDSEIYLKMLLYCAKLGVRIDKYQLKVVEDRDNDYKIRNPSSGLELPSKQIKEIYKQPLFIKACSTNVKTPLPKSLVLIAESLGVLSEETKNGLNVVKKKETCEALFKIYNDETERVKEDAMNRIKDRIRTTAYTLADFTSNPSPIIECENSGIENKDPLEYTDAALTYYRDEKTSKLYCFPSNMYEDIQASKFINPFTGDPISVEARNNITYQLELFEKLKINPNKIMTVETATGKLKENDDITNDNTDFAIRTIINMFQARGVPEPILKNIDDDTLNKILKIVSMCQGYIKDLPEKTHKFATFCKALYSYLKKNPTQVSDVLNAITVRKFK